MTDPASRQRYLIHEWADGCVVFDLATGDTHVLDAWLAGHFRAHLDGKSGADDRSDAALVRLAQMNLLD